MRRTAVQKTPEGMMQVRGPLHGLLTPVLRRFRSLKWPTSAGPGNMRRPLFSRLLALLSCIAVSAILIQAGSLFLSDQISANRALAWQARHHQLHWRHQADRARASGSATPETLQWDAAGDGAGTGREAFRGSRAPNAELNLELSRIAEAEDRIARAAAGGLPAADWLPVAEDLADSWARIGGLLQRELDTRRAAVLALQTGGLLILLFCVARIALDMRRALTDRLDSLAASLPDFGAPPPPGGDEIARLEGKLSGLTACLHGLIAENAAARETAGALRRAADAGEFVLRFVGMINTRALNDAMLRRVLHALERALGAQSAAILYTEDEPAISGGRAIWSSRAPAAMGDDAMDELRRSGLSTFARTDTGTRVTAVAFVEPSGETGALLIETDAGRPPDAAGMQLLHIAAGLLSITARFQNHDREGRRIAVLEERAAIARELHDSLAQSLSFMKIQLARLQSGLKTGAADTRAVTAELRTGLDNAYRELRELLATFRVHMDVRGLGHALQSAIGEFSQRSGLSISLDNRLENGRLTVNEEFHILQIVREALSNILRHAEAETVLIALSAAPDGTVRIVIDDDGIGYESAAGGRDHHGHAIMQERAHSLGGRIEVGTRPQGGTRVRLAFTPKSSQ
ncbi:histidine kinase [Pseudogemmobacter humi]|uniref:histidine kinase n=1 Tax=Pseudogemmobacter humi TaxID=2483812 RepID=A0A3P5WWS3_9RHOB|nr:histidine kinase [Pseudogemmobacter humi]VDC20467.1 Nitrate/nitrite sensor protein NarX [Pseudogemmobacter humi]